MHSQIIQDQMYETAHHLIHFFMLSDLRVLVVHGLHLHWLDESFGVPKSHDYHHFFAENLDAASDMSFKLHVRSKKKVKPHLHIGMCCCFTAPAIASP